MDSDMPISDKQYIFFLGWRKDLVGYQHIDLSIKKHGLYSEENLYGWKIKFMNLKKLNLTMQNSISLSYMLPMVISSEIRLPVHRGR